MVAIHSVVSGSQGIDEYTGLPLEWELISTYNNEESKAGRRQYKKAFASLPTVDHVGDGLGPADFRICSWRTNDSKNDLSYDEFIALCASVIRRHDERSSKGDPDRAHVDPKVLV